MKKYLYTSLLLLFGAITGAFSQSMIISGGGNHAIALCSKGQIYAWGANGEIGKSSSGDNRLCLADASDASKLIVNKPSLVNTGNLTFSMLSAGSGGHSVALSCYGIVYCWGANDYGQCGQAPSKYVTGGSPLPVKCGVAPGYTLDGQPNGEYLGNVKYISATSGASLAILENGRCVMWGGNETAVPGEFIKNSSETPQWVCGADGKPLENVIHVAGGDNNVLLIVGDSPDAKVGTVYSMGNLNGRGGGKNASAYVAEPVEIGNGKGSASSGQYLSGVRTSGLSDTGGMVVEGRTGYVYGWGDNGWWGVGGKRNAYASNMLYAEKVVAGEYEDVSGQNYLTDVIQIIGGNGSAAAVTQEGYLIYWGDNAGAKAGGSSGGVIPNSSYKSQGGTAQSLGPVFANYCAGEHGNTTETRIDDAVAIARGDMFGFMVNKDGDFYVWGTTELPGGAGNAGTLGTGKDSEILTCLKKIDISCTPQDLCPEAFMVGPRYKCPGVADSLYAGFSPLKGRDDAYFFQWTKDGVVLNTSTKTSSVADRKADKYNAPVIGADDPGVYRVDIYYIGLNVPCDNCPETYAEVEVIDMEMPIDTTIQTACVAKPLAPSSSDQLCYEVTVNNKFYKATDMTTFAAFSTIDSKDTLYVGSAKGAGGKIEFCITGDKVGKVNDNKDLPSNDTTYSIYLEDITSFDTYLFKDRDLDEGGNPQNQGIIIELFSGTELKSFDMAAKAYSTTGKVVVTPQIYEVAINENDGSYVCGKLRWEGKAQTFTVGNTVTSFTVECNYQLDGNSVRGSRYIIGHKLTVTDAQVMKTVLRSQSQSTTFTTPFTDSGKFNINAIGATANQYSSMSNAGNESLITNIKFGKLTDYTCGRIELQARYWCPPCNQPDGIVKIEQDGVAHTGEKDTIFLCKESDAVVLSVSNIKKASEPTAKFDELWFLDKIGASDAAALQVDLASTASTLKPSIAWDDTKEGKTEVYYVKIRDNEKPDASACYVLDSIFVHYNEVPVAPEVEIPSFCKGLVDDDVKAYLVTLTDLFKGLTPTIKLGATEVTLVGLEATLESLPDGTNTFTLSVVDDATGCESEETTFDVVVKAIPVAPTTTNIDEVVAAGSMTVEKGVTDSEGTLHWFEVKPTLPAATLSEVVPEVVLTVQNTYTFWVSQNVDGCESDTASFVVTINDSPVPEARDTFICAGESIADLSSLVVPNKTDAGVSYTLNWYTDLNAAKGTGDPSAKPTSFAEPKKYPFYVSQTNPETGAESNKKTFHVTAIGVDKPVLDPTNVLKYCASNELGTELKASFNQNESAQMLANGMVWSLKGPDGTYTENPNLVPVLDVRETTVYDYKVHQTYTIVSSGAVCAGEDVETSVTVTYVAPVTTAPVLYQKASADASGNFSENLIEHDAKAVQGIETGATLKWYEDGCVTEITTGTPTPKVDPTIPEGENQIVNYCVSQVVDGCESVKTPIQVTISDAFPPITYAYHYCEGQVMSDLTADANSQGGKPADNYDIYWYGTEKPANTSATPLVIGNSYSMGGALAALDATGEKTVLTYYVAQHDKSTDAVSGAQPVYVTIYPKPVVITTTPEATCEDPVDLSAYKSVTNVSEPLTYTYGSATTPDMGTSTVLESGKYQISATYTLPVNPSQFVIVNDGECVGDPTDINVTINDLTIPTIDGNPTTCPGTSISLTAVAASVDPGVISYSWSGDATTVADGSTTSEVLKTVALSTKPADTYSFSVTATAGACTKTVALPHIVTIGDGQVIGNMEISEEDLESMSFPGAIKKEVWSCGNPVTITVGYEGDKDFVWYKDGVPFGTGPSITTDAYSTYNDAVYTVEFTNECKASTEVTIHTVPVTATPLATDKIEICEGETFKTGFTYTLKPGETPTITWYHDGATVGGQTSENLILTNTRDEDDGLYSYEINNRGCIKKGDANSLNVRPYIKATISSEPFIVARHGNETLPITVQVPSPSSGKILNSISWIENGAEVFNGNPYEITDVVADHNYTIEMTDPDYCSLTLNAVVYVDAELQLNTSLKDTLCLGTSDVLVIDTTGTGAFRRPSGNPILNVTATIGGTSFSLNDKITKSGDMLHVTVDPVDDAEYNVSFTYAGQSKDKTEKVHVIPAISLTVPEIPNICEGTETVLTVTNISPDGTTISWASDPTIVEGSNSESVRVKPTYKGGADHQALYTYQAIAYNAFCDKSKAYEVKVLVDEPLTGDITGVKEICEGGETSFTAASYEAKTYTWTASDGSVLSGEPRQSVKPAQTTTYTVDMVRGLCTAKDEYTVTVHTNPVIQSIDSVGLRDRAIVLNPDFGTAPFTYGIDAQAPDANDIKHDLTFTSHVVFVSDAYGCKTSQQFELNAPEIYIPIIVTPGTDGVNDKWVVPNLAELYPNAIVSIYDRYGKLLAQYLGADTDGWDCTYNGHDMPSTDYWYQITIEEINREYVGHFTLIRR